MHLEVRKKSGSLLCLLLAFLLLLPGCGADGGESSGGGSYTPPDTGAAAPVSPPAEEATPSPVPPSRQVLTLACGELGGSFHPLFAAGEGDRLVLRLTQTPLLAADAFGVIPEEAPRGDFPGAAGVKRSPRDDGSVVYRISMREDLRLPDGGYADVQDLLFTLYVLLDPDYDGPSALKDCPIRGLTEYRCQTGQAETCRELYREAAQGLGPYGQLAREALEAAWLQELDALTKFCRDSYLADYAEYALGMSAETVRGDAGLLRAFTLWCSGLADAAGTDGILRDVFGGGWYLGGSYCPGEEDLYRIVSGYYGSPRACDEALGTRVEARAEEVFIRSLAREEEAYRASVLSVSGIRVVDDYTLELTVERDSEEELRCLRQLWLLSLDTYGDRALFRPEEGSYGFPYGDLSAIREISEQGGFGPYAICWQEGSLPYLEANPYYYLGAPAISAVEFLPLPEEGLLAAVADGSADAAMLSGNRERFFQAEQLGLLTVPVASDVFGCLSLWNEGVKLADGSGDEALRRAVLTVLQACCADSARDYFGAAALVTEMPSVEEAAARAKELLLGLGFAETETGLSAPEAVELSLLIPGGGTGDHPCWAGALQAAEQLQRLGISLRVTDVRHSSRFWELVDRREADLWAAAEQLPVWADALSGEPVFSSAGAQLLLYQRNDLAVFSPERVQKDSIPAGQTLSCDWISRIQDLQLR